jgi:prophage antirepressor-like protein
MTQKHKIQLFEDKKVRTVWDDQEEKWYFSIVDVCGVLTEQLDYDHAKNYWKVLKHRLIKEGNESVTNRNQLKMLAPDGKMRFTDVADRTPTF